MKPKTPQKGENPDNEKKKKKEKKKQITKATWPKAKIKAQCGQTKQKERPKTTIHDCQKQEKNFCWQ